MKNLRGMLAIVLIVALAATLVPLTAIADTTSEPEFTSAGGGSFPDVPANHTHFDAITVLSALDIVRGFPGGYFAPERNVTRAEFTAMLMRTLNLEEIGEGTADIPFTDIDGVYWAIPNIATAYRMGIVNGIGEGLFAPNENVLFEQAIAMILRALGYGMIAANNEGETWFSGYMVVASQRNIIVNTEGTVGAPATRQTNAQLIYNSLEVPIMSIINDVTTPTTQTLLNDRLRVNRAIGQVSANDLTGLFSPEVDLRADEIQIITRGASEPITYRTTSPELRGILGYEVTFYYSIDSVAEVRTIILATRTRGNTIEIDANQLDSGMSDFNNIRYFRNPETDRSSVSARIADDNVVIYNGRLAGGNRGASRFDPDMLPELGSVRLIDSNNNGQFDVIFIESFDVFVVNTTVGTPQPQITEVLAFGRTSARVLALDIDDPNSDVRIIGENGATMSFGQIRQWDVVHLMESRNPGRRLRTAVVVRQTASGVITEDAGDSIVVGGRRFGFSPLAIFDTATRQNRLTLGDNATFYLDIEGNIVAYNPTASQGNEMFGYIMAADLSGTAGFGNQRAQVRIINQNGQRQDLELSPNVRINGTLETNPANQLDLLRDAAIEQNSDLRNPTMGSSVRGTEFTGLVRFTTTVMGGNNVINSITTVLGDGLTIDAAAGAQTYTYRNGVLEGNTGLPLLRPQAGASGTLIFRVPNDRREHTRFTVSRYNNNTFRNYSVYQLDAFNVSGIGVVGVIVLYGEADNEINPATVVNIFDSISSELVGGETVTTANVWNHTSENLVSVRVAPEGVSLVESLNRGDMFRFGTTGDGHLNEIEVLMRVRGVNPTGIARHATGTQPGHSNQGLGADNAIFRFISGSVLEFDQNQDGTQTTHVQLAAQILTLGMNLTQLPPNAIISRANFTGARFFTVTLNAAGTEFTVLPSTINMLESLQSFRRLEDVDFGDDVTPNPPTELAIYMSEGRVRMVVEIVRQ